MKRFAKSMLVLLALAVGAPAWAQGGVHQHDGLFLRLTPGLSYLHSSASQAGNDVSVYGGAGDFGLAIGGALTDNLILAGHVYATAATDPDTKLNGVTGTLKDSTLVGIGPQLTYYFMPVNVYLSGTLALTRLSSTSNGGVEGKTDAGVGLRLEVGKEWWVSDNWGLGVAGHVGFSSNKDQGDGAPRVGSWTSGVAFSATFN